MLEIYKPYSLRIPIPLSKEAEMDKILGGFKDKLENINKEIKNITLIKWGGKDIKIKALIYWIKINSFNVNMTSYIIESRAIIADLLKSIVQDGILSINQMKLVSIVNGFGLDEKIETNLGAIAKIELKEKLI